MGAVYFMEDGGTTFSDPGRIRDASFDFSAVVGSPDTGGRKKTNAIDVTLTFTLMQSDTTTLSGVAGLANPSGDGVTIAMTNTFATPTKDGTTGAITGAEFVFHGCLPETSGSFPLNGDERGFPITVTGRVPVSELASLASTGEMSFGTGGAS